MKTKKQIQKEINTLETGAVNGPGFTPFISKKLHSLYAELNKLENK